MNLLYPIIRLIILVLGGSTTAVVIIETAPASRGPADKKPDYSDWESKT